MKLALGVLRVRDEMKDADGGFLCLTKLYNDIDEVNLCRLGDKSCVDNAYLPTTDRYG